MSHDLASMIPALQSTILRAGETVMAVYHSDFEVYGKADQSPVTEADRRGEEIIEAALKELAPDIPIVGEEAKSEGKCPDISGGTFWLVDPLDGTKEFIKKGSDFTVNIGLIKGGNPVMGLVLAPAMNKLYWGNVGQGAWIADVEDGELVNERPVATRPSIGDKLTIVASKSHRSQELEAWLSHFPSADHVSIGSSLKLCLLATGEADLYPRLGPTCEWDTAAAHAVLLAAGGSVEVAGGTPLTYGKDLTTFLNPWFLCKADPSFDTPDLAS
ncbi:3'(2'),5'-bisphosphate nucleotidase CysQ [Kordiimonas lacus]|uniref:3'(2'),5'-bisphosphate nucleotidase CysQ n=1 Tax=Kordiimonas lacus TaxID=637679 RepID=A0A1G6YVY9_9PROT|nr:3'(2'),5'-bisphosphate nucleotidase CysQ [Kordiimonas lacus]SDD93787.1 3'(2'),5'-bisphosphate nucleotidase [Kordiimonas lacus]